MPEDEEVDPAIRKKLGFLYEPARVRAKPGPKPQAGLDDADLALLRALNVDARKSYRDLSKELGLALSTVSARVKRLEEQGYITGYVPVVDPVKLGFDLVVVIGVKIAHGKLLEAQKRIAKAPRVFGVYDVTGEWDSIVLARFRSREELNDFIKDLLSLPYVERTGTQLVLNTVKEEKRVLF
ncbi:MAG TPA: Lrp/AsnC family transcriptional regulator [Candidatus Thermoplasmatota archaeon]|nr:Lrp/AsnC family transcriptional regulator [Candidatus Thermoplasmatota archaeon]